jgi:hypothetical protein
MQAVSPKVSPGNVDKRKTFVSCNISESGFKKIAEHARKF